MYDVMIYAALATIVCVMLYSVLGKNIGMGPDDKFDPSAMMQKKPSKEPLDPAMAAQRAKLDKLGVGAITVKDPNFSPAEFIQGAKAAYSMILEAYANGDREQLGELLTDEVYAIYDSAITEREAKSYRQVTDLARLRKASIQSASVEGKMARIHVLYEAELTSALLDESGTVMQGDTDTLSSISEVWEYERDLKSGGPEWKLAAVAPSEGDGLPADPTPDTKG